MRDRGVLLDTNFISAWRAGRVTPPTAVGPLYISTTALQELYNMQGREGWEYAYTVPMTTMQKAPLPLLAAQAAHFRAFLRRHPSDHITRRMKRWTDSFSITLPVYFAAQVHVSELCHSTLARIHKKNAAYIIRETAQLTVGKNIAELAMDNYYFLVEQQVQPIPADDTIGELAVRLLKDFLASGTTAKGKPRNTFNDLMILATALNYGLDLLTDDKLLKRLAVDHGMRVSVESMGFFNLTEQPDNASTTPKNEIGGYVNSQWRKLPPRMY